MKLKKQIVYKVVYNSNDGYRPVSLFNGFIGYSSKLCVKYEIGKIIKPPIGKLFIFLTFEDALKYKRSLYSDKSLKIIKCEASGVQEAPNVICSLSFISESKIEKFWSSGKAVDPWNTPEKTYLCDSLTPIAVVKK